MFSFLTGKRAHSCSLGTCFPNLLGTQTHLYLQSFAPGIILCRQYLWSFFFGVWGPDMAVKAADNAIRHWQPWKTTTWTLSSVWLGQTEQWAAIGWERLFVLLELVWPVVTDHCSLNFSLAHPLPWASPIAELCFAPKIILPLSFVGFNSSSSHKNVFTDQNQHGWIREKALPLLLQSVHVPWIRLCPRSNVQQLFGQPGRVSNPVLGNCGQLLQG